jgi:co-chaperonin GroES (HSP10)
MIRPLHDGIAVRPDAPIKHSLFVLPDSALDDVRTGTVVAVGTGKRLPSGAIRPIMVAVGDRVQYSGTIDTTFDDLILMKDGDLIGLV